MISIMGKRGLRFAFLSLLMVFTTQIAAQAPIEEGFESGIPSDWSQEPATGVTAWAAGPSGLSGISAYDGVNYVSLSTTIQQQPVKLVTKMVDVSSVNAPELSFYLVQQARLATFGNARDTLRVWYRTTAGSPWQALRTFSGNVPTWAQQTISLEGRTSGNIQLAFEFVYGGGLGLAIDQVRVGAASVCTKPTSLRASMITSQGAKLSWSVHTSTQQSCLKVSTMPLTNPATGVADVLDTTLFFTNFDLTGLTAHTTYYFYVKAKCAHNDVSNWSDAGIFRTGCTPIVLPYTEAFNTTSQFSDCWFREFSYAGDWDTITPNPLDYTPNIATSQGGHPNVLKLYGYYYIDTEQQASGSRTTTAWAATPELNVDTTITNKQVTFLVYATNRLYKLHVGLMHDALDEAAFTELATVSVNKASTWEEVTVPFSGYTGIGTQLAFRVSGTDNNAEVTMYVDSVVVEDIPLCQKASVLNAINVGGTCADLTWIGTAPSWNVKLSTMPLSDPQTATGAGVLSFTTDSMSYHVTGLSELTHYYFYVQANCSAAGHGTSVWSNVREFTTTQTPATLPYTCNFEGAEASQWLLLNGTDGQNKWAVGTATNNGIGSHALYVSKDNGVTNEYNTGSTSYVYALRTLHFEAGTYRVSFDWKCAGETRSDLLNAYLVPAEIILAADEPNGMNSSNNTTPNGWIGLAGAAGKFNESSAWQRHAIEVNITNRGSYNLVFFWKNDMAFGTQPPAAVDNISVRAFTCLTPDSIAVTNITQTSARVGWSPSRLGETQWDLKVSTTQIDPDSTAGDVYSQTVTASTVNLTSLRHATLYYVYLRSNCGASNGDGDWISISFRTECGSIDSLPYIADFSDCEAGPGNSPICWTLQPGNSAQCYVTGVNNHTEGVGVPSRALCMSRSYSGTNVLAALPAINVAGKTLRNMQMEFFMRAHKTPATLYVGVMTDPADRSTLITIDTLAVVAPNAWENKEVYFTNYTGTAKYIVFLLEGRDTIYIDDVHVSEVPACLRPVPGITTSNITQTSAHIAWTPRGSATSWEVAYGPKGFDPATVTPIAVNDSAVYTMNGLTAGTAYDVYVRSNCGGTDGVSAWIKGVVVTRQMPGSLPYHANFENAADDGQWTFVNGTQSNKWMIGSGTNNGTGSRALYVSDNGLANNYNTNTISDVCAMQLLQLPIGKLHVSFDWKCDGEGSYDYMRVYVVPDAVTIQAGTNYESIPTGWIALGGRFSRQTAWVTFNDTIDIHNAGQYNLVFYWHNDQSSGNQPPAAIDNLLLEELHGCFRSGDIALSNLTGNTVTAAWGISEGAPTYRLKVSETSLTDPTTGIGTVLDTTLAVNTYTLTGLQPNTHYYIYVQTVCGGQTFAWSRADFTTACADVTNFPFTEDFEGELVDRIPRCWTRLSASSFPQSVSGADHNHTTNGNHGMEFWSGGGSANLVTPRLNVDSISKYRVECFIKKYDVTTYSGSIVVGVMVDPSDESTFVPIDTLTAAPFWEKHVVRLAAYNGTGKYIVFAYLSGDTDLDDITILEDRECDQPTLVRVSNITQDDALIKWNIGSTSANTSYNVKIATTPINPDSVNTGLVLSETGITNTYFQISDAMTLTPNTTYWVYVQSECGAADGRGSYWSDGMNFTTTCPIQNIPFTENFAGMNGKYPSCWQVLTEQGGASMAVAPSCSQMSPYFDADSTSLCMQVNYASTSSGVDYTRVIAVLPEFAQSLQALQLDFAARSSSTSRTKVYVGVMTDIAAASSFTVIDSIVLSNTWRKYVVGFNHYTGSGKYIGWRLAGDDNVGARTIYLDAIAVDSLKACNAPTHVQVSGVASNTANISWSAVGTTQQFEVIVSTKSYNITALDSLKTAGAASIVADTTVNGTQWVVTGLNAATTYYAYVRTACGSTGTNYYYHTPVEFRTTCGMMTLPYSDSFEYLGTDMMPECWTRFGNAVRRSTTSSATDGTAILRFNGSSSSRVTALAVSPEIGTTDWSTLEASFRLRALTWLSSDSLRLFEVGVMNDPTDSTSFVPVDTLTLSESNAFREYFVPLASYTGIGKHIAFRVSGKRYSIYIDELLVHVRPSCYRPDVIMLMSASRDNLVVDWTPHVATDSVWQLSYGLPGFDPDAGTLVTANTHPFTLTGLQSSTPYEIYVRANCSAADGMSDWRGPLSARTAQEPVVLPYVQDFEDHAENARWVMSNDVNGWFIGSAAHKDGSNGLYVSNDNGLTRGYDKSNSSYSYAMRLLSIPADLINISFDWIGDNEGSYDCAHAFLVPAAQVSLLKAGQSNGLGSYSSPTPNGWIELKKKMSGEPTNWQHVDLALNVDSAGDYYLTFFWKDDGGGGAGDGTGIDNIAVSVSTYCGVTIKNVISNVTDAEMSWSGRYDSVRVKVFTTAQTLAAVDTLTGDVFNGSTVDSTFTITGLQPSTTYYYYLNPVCGGNGGSWVTDTFRTRSACTLVMRSVTPDTTGVVLMWVSHMDSVRVIVDTVNHALTAIDTLSGFLCDTIVTTDTFRLGHLTPVTTYYYYVRSVCTSDSNSWKTGTVVTKQLPLHLPYVCDFENVGENAAWTLVNGSQTNQWYVGTAANNGGTRGLYISKDNGATNDYDLGETSTTYAVRGPLNIEPGIYNFSYDWRCNGEVFWGSGSDYLRVFLVPEDVSLTAGAELFGSTGAPTGWIALDDGQYLADNSTWQSVSKEMALSTAGYYNIVFCWINDWSSGNNPAAAIDNVTVRRSVCFANIDTISSTTNSINMKLSNSSGSVCVKVFSSRQIVDGSLQTRTADVCDTVVDSVLTINNLRAGTTYYYYVAAICNGIYGIWSSDSIQTECSLYYTLPYTESFNGSRPCVTTAIGTQATIFGGGTFRQSTGNDYEWELISASGAGGMDQHERLEIHGSYVSSGGAYNIGTNAWLITPNVILGSTDTTVVLSFDMALTAARGRLVPGQQSDDRFVIMASVDGGTTWTANNVLAEWNNTGSTRVFDQIPSTKTRVYVPVKHFAGDTVKIAFYGESLANNGEMGDNYMHIDNVNMVAAAEVHYIDNVCYGHNYQGYGFDLTDTAITTSPTKEFSRYANDTLYILTLTVKPLSEYVITDTICTGETYTQYGFNFTASASGTYHRYLTAANGCDSIVTLNLTALPAYTATDSMAICQNQLPFVWHGQSCTGGGTYNYRGNTAGGCDSVLTLVLTVNPTYNRSDSKTINSSELPYTYGDTVFAVGTQSGTFVLHRQTAAGCDSVVTLTLTVQTVGLDIAAGGLFDLSPNPVEHGGKVRVHADFTAADLDGLRIEILSSNGARVRDFRPDSYPIWIVMPEESGLYMVRITTGTGKVLYGKVLVK